MKTTQGLTTPQPGLRKAALRRWLRRQVASFVAFGGEITKCPTRVATGASFHSNQRPVIARGN